MRVVKKPDLTMDMPDRKFWQRVATQATKEIRDRTEGKGQDIEGKPFGAYSSDYLKRRLKGRVSKPGGGFHGPRGAMQNLSLSSKMLGSMARGITATNKGAKIKLSGAEGGKAWNLERQGKVFFGISRTAVNKIMKGVDAWMARKNKLK